MKDLVSELEMLCIVVIKEKNVPFCKTLLFTRGGAQLGGHSKKFNVFGGSGRKCLK